MDKSIESLKLFVTLASKRMEPNWERVRDDQSLSVDYLEGYAQSGLDWLSILNLLVAEIDMDRIIGED